MDTTTTGGTTSPLNAAQSAAMTELKALEDDFGALLKKVETEGAADLRHLENASSHVARAVEHGALAIFRGFTGERAPAVSEGVAVTRPSSETAQQPPAPVAVAGTSADAAVKNDMAAATGLSPETAA